MKVIIDEVLSQVHAVDGQLGPETMRSIVEAVLAAVNRQQDHERQVERERSSGGEPQGLWP